MIAFLQGQPIGQTEDQLILNVKGVGYELFCSQNTLADVADRDIVQLHVYTHLRQDALHLFGFSKSIEKKMFLSLIKVNGIGPKLALNILSASPTDKFIDMLDRGDVKALTKLPKVGKKTAEQMVLSLKGKLVLDDHSQAAKSFVARGDIISALVNLGFRLNDVEVAVDSMEPETDLQQGIRQGLAALTTQV